MPWSNRSLRAKLILACVLVQLVAGALVLASSQRLLQQTLVQQAQAHTRHVVTLLEQAIATPLAQRDYATLQQTLDLLRDDKTLAYLVLHDHRERAVAGTGWDTSQPLPPRDGADIDLDRADTTLHLSAPLVLAGQSLGRIHIGLSTLGLREARASQQRRSLAIAGAALLLSMAVLAAIALAITRHLGRLADASLEVAQGRYDIQIPVGARDEIGRLAATFNAMAASLKHRVAALEESERQQRRHLHAAREEQSRLTTLLGAMESGIVFVDEHGLVIYANRSFARIWSLSHANAGDTLQAIVPAIAQQLVPTDTAHARALLHPENPEATLPRELRTLDGRTITQRAQPVTTGAGASGWIWFHDDVTAERQMQQRAQQALHDPLTRLLNRRGLYEQLHGALAIAGEDGRAVALLFVDLDDFKYANDIAGHQMGDRILVSVAGTLKGQLRRDEIVARLGGDEFAVVCPGLGGEEAAAVAARLVGAIAELQFEASSETVRIGCSIGVAAFPADAGGVDELIACADRAMYQAKQGGKNTWARHRSDPQHAQAESARVNWNARLHRALAEDRFVLHFQPVRRAEDLTLAHHEALVRMLDEGGRIVAPAEFIPHAERSGKVRQLDRWVFERCVATLAIEASSVQIAANLSMRSLEDPGFPLFLDELLRRHGVQAGRLHIELTETSAISDAVAAARLIDALRGLGCSVHLDDFGSGFASFAQLKQLQVDAIKIDGVFIRELVSDRSNQLFVASMIDIAHSLGKQAIAEHIEDEATLVVLRSLGIDLVQGYHLGRPNPQLAAMAMV